MLFLHLPFLARTLHLLSLYTVICAAAPPVSSTIPLRFAQPTSDISSTPTANVPTNVTIPAPLNTLPPTDPFTYRIPRVHFLLILSSISRTPHLSRADCTISALDFANTINERLLRAGNALIGDNESETFGYGDAEIVWRSNELTRWGHLGIAVRALSEVMQRFEWVVVEWRLVDMRRVEFALGSVRR